MKIYNYGSDYAHHQKKEKAERNVKSTSQPEQSKPVENVTDNLSPGRGAAPATPEKAEKPKEEPTLQTSPKRKSRNAAKGEEEKETEVQ